MPSICPESITESDSSAIRLKITDHPKVVMMGGAGVGKTAIVHRFLYDKYPTEHVPTVEEMHKSVYDFSGCILSLDLLDTSGSYQFPAMRRLAIRTCDAFILVYSIDSYESFKQVSELRELVMEIRDENDRVPIVVVGNKCDLEDTREVSKDITESVVTIDWENGFVEASAKDDINITDIFKAVLEQAHIPYDLEPAVDRRRKSLPADSSSPHMKRRISLKRNSCTIQ